MSRSLSPPWSHPIRISELSLRNSTPILLEPDADTCQALAVDLGIDGLRKLRFDAVLSPTGTQDWQLKARLGATVVQPCVVTGAPVTTRIDEDVSRLYLADMPEIEVEPGAEIEMPLDDMIDPLPAILDLGLVMAEALALALPLYPRAEGAALEQAQFAAPGVDPMRDEDALPFSGLKALRDKLADKE